MRTVWKFELPIGVYHALELPPTARLLHVGVQDDLRAAPVLWVDLDPMAVRQTRVFRVIGTGDALTDDEVHVGTCMARAGGLVWHVYERGRR